MLAVGVAALPKPPSRVMATELTSTSVKLVWSWGDGEDRGGPSSTTTSPSYVIQYVDKSVAATAADTHTGKDGLDHIGVFPLFFLVTFSNFLVTFFLIFGLFVL